MKYYLDYNNGNIFKNLDETRFNVTTDFNQKATHYLLLSDEQVAYKEAHPYASPYDIWNMTMEEPIIYSLESLKENILSEIEKYDKSDNVNLFYVNGEGAWLDRDTRVSLMNSTTILKNSNIETTTLWLNNTPYVINCDLLIQMLGNLEIYALQCYNITEQHKANINNLQTVEDIKQYNYTAEYPEKLIFTV